MTVAPGPGAVSVSDVRASATVSVRRFAPAFSALGTVRPGETGIVSVRRDAATQPWHLQLQSLLIDARLRAAALLD